MRRFPNLLITLLISLCLIGPAYAEAPKDVSHFKLDNGLEVVVIEDHRAPVVVQMVWYKIGAADEVSGTSGIAHFLEHLMFKGTDKLAAGELSKIVAANGGTDNAFTSYDYTAFHQRIASDRLGLIMEMEADRMANLHIRDEDWKAERQVILEERSQRIDGAPRALFAEEESAAQFLNHPYGRPIIGWRDEMEELTRDDALAWYKRYYAPNNAVLILAGDVTPDKARELADKYYGPIPAKKDAARGERPQEPRQHATRRLEMTDPRVPQPMMTRSVLVPERNPGDQKTAAALTVLAELLGGSAQTSVLGQKLMMTGKALYVSAGYDGDSVDPTRFYFSLIPANGQAPEDAEKALDQALEEFLADGVDPAQLERVKTQIEAAQIYARDSAHARAYEYGQGLATGLSVEDVNDWPEILGAVTEDEIMAAAEMVVGSTASVTGWLKPAEADGKADGADDMAQAPPETAPEAEGAAHAEPGPHSDAPSEEVSQ